MIFDLALEVNCEDLIDFLDEEAHLRNELNEALWNEDHTIVLASARSLTNNLNNLVGNVINGHVLAGDFLTNQTAVDPCLQSTLKCNMRGRSSHESNEVIVLARRNGIGREVTNGLGVDLGCGIETKTNFDMLVFQVTIDCFWTANNTTLGAVFGEVLCKEASVGVGVITANDGKTIKIKGVDRLERGLELLWSLNLVTT